ncbi:choice-of-anchor Q domain-containing protein [Haloferula sp.]|uniref:choice-of-anchor Q domain-containing protein n=1 Tax=Haloferula sp. TaxID=2497595 RepID=UPI00329FB13D
MLLRVFPLLFLSAHLYADDPPTEPTTLLIADGDSAQYSFFTTPPTNWFDPDVSLAWDTAPAGFGGTDRAAEVSTVEAFRSIRLRQRFDLLSTPLSLTLSLKQDDANVMVYLNGVLVIDLKTGQLPSTDSDGFRNYDLSTRIPLLNSAENLLAVYSQGSILTPILHATSSDTMSNFIALNPTQTRLVEGGQELPIRVFRLSPTSSSTLLFLPPASESSTSVSDFRITLDGLVLPVITNDNGAYVQVPFSGEESSKVIDLEITDDIHAEGQETIEISAYGPETRLVISRNDVIVTRTAEQGEGSLRQAIENAELIPGIETIRFDDAEGVPFSQAPVTVHLNHGSPGRYGLREGFVLEGPASPGRVTLQANGGPLFYISGAGGAAASQDLTLRRLVICGSSLVVESTRYSGTMLIEDCEFIDNEQALDLYSRDHPALVRRCLFTENTQECISTRSGLRPRIENCSFAFNPATNIDGSPIVESCTFAGDSTRFASGGAEFKNCLFSGTGSDINYSNSNFDQGGNLFAGTLRGDTPLTPRHPDSLAVDSSSAGLGELGHHGGFTRTIPILPNSPALDLGLFGDDDSPEFDQRDQPYLRRVGLAPDSGAFERQLADDDLFIGITTSVTFDPTTGLYFQFAVIHNQSPWTLDGFQLEVAGLPADAFLYNASEPGAMNIAGPLLPSDYRIVVLQYSASRPDLLLSPELSLSFDSSAADPYQVLIESPELSIHFDENGAPCLNFRTEPGGEYQVQISDNATEWQTKGPAILSESNHIIWKDRDTLLPSKLLYRISSSN